MSTKKEPKAPKEPVVHKDIIQQDLVVGDLVVCLCPGDRGMQFGHVVKLTPKMVIVATKRHGKDGFEARCYPHDVCKVEPSRATYLYMKGVA